jgi:hypothetical protein
MIDLFTLLDGRSTGRADKSRDDIGYIALLISFCYAAETCHSRVSYGIHDRKNSSHQTKGAHGTDCSFNCSEIEGKNSGRSHFSASFTTIYEVQNRTGR